MEPSSRNHSPLVYSLIACVVVATAVWLYFFLAVKPVAYVLTPEQALATFGVSLGGEVELNMLCDGNNMPEKAPDALLWNVICERSNDSEYTGIYWKRSDLQKLSFQNRVINSFLRRATVDPQYPLTGKFTCEARTFLEDVAGMKSAVVDCITTITDTDAATSTAYTTFIYSSPTESVEQRSTLVIVVLGTEKAAVGARVGRIYKSLRSTFLSMGVTPDDVLGGYFIRTAHAQDGGDGSVSGADSGTGTGAATGAPPGSGASGGDDPSEGAFGALGDKCNGTSDFCPDFSWPLSDPDPVFVPISTLEPDPSPTAVPASVTCTSSRENEFEFTWDCKTTTYFTNVETCTDGTVTRTEKSYEEAAVSCPVVPDDPVVPVCSSSQGQACTSTPNTCGQTNTGIIQCDDSCSAVTPPDSSCPVIPSGCGPGTLNDTCPVLPDLTASAVVGATTVSVREKVPFTATITNIGSAAVDKSFDGFMQVETVTLGSIEDLRSSKIVETSGRRTLRSLSSGATGLLETEHTFTAVGNYNVRACADKSSRSDSGTIEETNEDNNCGPWSPVSVVVPLPTATLTATPSRIVIGKDSTLQWTSENATSCTSAGGFSTNDKKSGNEKVSPLVTSTYSITCSGDGGTSAPAVATVTVIVPTLAITATPARVLRGGQTTVSWNATDVRRCSIERNGSPWRSNMSANDADVVSGSVADTITTQTTYVLSCTDVDGSAYATVASVVVNVAADFQEF